jgi:hypothetical protein
MPDADLAGLASAVRRRMASVPCISDWERWLDRASIADRLRLLEGCVGDAEALAFGLQSQHVARRYGFAVGLALRCIEREAGITATASPPEARADNDMAGEDFGRFERINAGEDQP